MSFDLAICCIAKIDEIISAIDGYFSSSSLARANIIICCLKLFNEEIVFLLKIGLAFYTRLYVDRLANRFIFLSLRNCAHNTVHNLSMQLILVDSFLFSVSCPRQQIKHAMKYESHYVHRWIFGFGFSFFSFFSFFFISEERIFPLSFHLPSDHLHFIIYNQTLNARLISQDAAINLHTTLIIYADSTSFSGVHCRCRHNATVSVFDRKISTLEKNNGIIETSKLQSAFYIPH